MAEAGVGECLVLADEGDTVVKAEPMGSELASEEGGHGGWEDVVEALLRGDVLLVDPEDSAQLGVRVAPVASAIEGLQLAFAAGNRCGDSIGSECGKWAGGAGAHAALQVVSDAAKARVDNERCSRGEGDAVGVVSAKAELEAAEEERGVLAYEGHATWSGLHEVGARVVGKLGVAQSDGSEKAMFGGRVGARRRFE